MRFSSLEQICEHKFAGNYLDDAEAFRAINDWCTRELEATRRAIDTAQRHISVAGMGEDYSDELTIQDCVAEFATRK